MGHRIENLFVHGLPPSTRVATQARSRSRLNRRAVTQSVGAAPAGDLGLRKLGPVANLGSENDLAARARAWRAAELEAVCDVIRPWSGGVVARATRYPHYYEYNLVRVTGRPMMGVAELSAVADAELAGLAH